MAENCKVYTPREYVDEVLNAIEYSDNLFGKSVLENSCGIGDILCTIVERYIATSINAGMDHDDIKNGLERDICGTEIELDSVNECKRNLSRISERYDIFGVNWQIIHCDYLKYNMGRSFDYVIGNPPYIVYRDINKSDQEYIRNHFNTCKKWMFDYYYAFIEKSVMDLSADGKMAYIVPYSFYKNEGASLARELIKPYVTHIFDYTHSKKFPGVITSSTLLVLQKCLSETLRYHDVNSGVIRTIPKESLLSKWTFNDTPYNEGEFVFGDYYSVHNTVATLYNKAFVLNEFEKIDGYYRVGKKQIEDGIVKPAISRKKGKQALNVAIIFPYYFQGGKLMHYTELELKSLYPYAYDYLSQFKDKLENKTRDGKTEWFEYGKSQALTTVFSEKIVFPSIETKKITVTIVDKEMIPLAGFFVTAKSKRHTLEEAKRILESPAFYTYLCYCGVFTTGHSRRISVKDVLSYRFSEWVK